MKLSRRALLKTGLGAGTLVLAGGLGLRWLAGDAPDVQGLRVLSAAQYHTLSLVAQAHLPRTTEIPLGAQDLDLARLFDGYLADQPQDDQREAALAIRLVELGPLIFERRLTTFSRLTEAERDAHWRSWAKSPHQVQREIWWSLARFFGLAFYDQPSVWPHIGYPGPSLARLAAQPKGPA